MMSRVEVQRLEAQLVQFKARSDEIEGLLKEIRSARRENRWGEYHKIARRWRDLKQDIKHELDEDNQPPPQKMSPAIIEANRKLGIQRRELAMKAAEERRSRMSPEERAMEKAIEIAGLSAHCGAKSLGRNRIVAERQGDGRPAGGGK